MDFGANKTPVEVIHEGAFGGTFQRYLFWCYRKVVQKVMERIGSVKKILIRSFIAQVIMMLVLINMVLNAGHRKDFGKIKIGLMKQIFMAGFSGILDTGQVALDDKRQINRWKQIVNRFKGKSVKMIKDTGSKFDDYSISPKIRKILLHWGYELTEKDFFINSAN